MCLVALALDLNRRFPLVIAANRDEYFDRPATRMGWWNPGHGGPDILSGRDERAGGTWLGLTAEGRLGLLTNVRRPTTPDPEAPSRGLIVPNWLRGQHRIDRFWFETALLGHQPFNLITADFRKGECHWSSSEARYPLRIESGVHGLSNGALDEPWPKVQRLKRATALAMAESDSVDDLAQRLFAALADTTVAPDDELPHTGVSQAAERMLSPAFIRSPDQRYGTRCSTLVITERVGKRLVTHALERTFTNGNGLALLRRTTLRNWPPRYTEGEAPKNAEVSPVDDAVLAERGGEPVKRTRARSLIKPAYKV